LTAEQIEEWAAYDKIDPIGGFRQDYESAAIQSTVQTLALAIFSKRGVRPEFTTYQDFMPRWGEKDTGTQVQSVEEMKDVLMALAASQKKRTRTKPNNNSKPERK
jgi:hypothetical protein